MMMCMVVCVIMMMCMIVFMYINMFVFHYRHLLLMRTCRVKQFSERLSCKVEKYYCNYKQNSREECYPPLSCRKVTHTFRENNTYCRLFCRKTKAEEKKAAAIAEENRDSYVSVGEEMPVYLL